MFRIFTDSGANLPEKIINKYNIGVVSFTCIIDGDEFECYSRTNPFDYGRFYEALRAKRAVKTSMINESVFYDAFKSAAQNGEDILYIGLSSALSGTYNAAVSAINKLKEQYGCKMIAIDTLTGSIGEGLLCLYAAKMREAGIDIDKTAARIRSLIPHLRTRMSCSDLFYIKRGGRISAATAVAGTLMGIKPLLKAGGDGVITVYDKVRGRKAALDKLVSELEQSVDKTKRQIVAISNADCETDAEYIKSKIKHLPYISSVMSEPMEPVTASHGGPGMIALFYLADTK